MANTTNIRKGISKFLQNTLTFIVVFCLLLSVVAGFDVNSKFEERKFSGINKLDNYLEKNRDDFSSFIVEIEDSELVKRFNGRELSNKLVALELNQIELKSFLRLSEVTKVYANREYSLLLDDSVPLMSVNNYWDSGLDGSGVKIAILDTGIDSDHEMLNGKVVDAEAFVTNDPQDHQGHGTHVAGIAAGDGSLKGVAPGASLLNAKVLNDQGKGTTESIVNGIYWAVENGADVISISIGAPEAEQDILINDAIDYAISQNVIVVVASGNCGPEGSSSCKGYEGVTIPGSYEEVITVGAVDNNLQWATFSSGDSFDNYIKPDVVAPGVSIMSSTPYGYATKQGTSMAAPFVSGAVALLLEEDSSLDHYQVKEKLENSALDLGTEGKDEFYGSGFVSFGEVESEPEESYGLIIEENLGSSLYISKNMFVEEEYDYIGEMGEYSLDDSFKVGVLEFENEVALSEFLSANIKYTNQTQVDEHTIYYTSNGDYFFWVSENNFVWILVEFDVPQEMSDLFYAYLEKYPILEEQSIELGELIVLETVESFEDVYEGYDLEGQNSGCTDECDSDSYKTDLSTGNCDLAADYKEKGTTHSSEIPSTKVDYCANGDVVHEYVLDCDDYWKAWCAGQGGPCYVDTIKYSEVSCSGEYGSDYSCSNGECAKDNCASQAYHACANNGDIYWFDSCGDAEGVKEYCDYGCDPVGEYCYECNDNGDCSGSEVCVNNQCQVKDCDYYGLQSCNNEGALDKSGNEIYECKDQILVGVILCWEEVSENGDNDFCELASDEGSDCTHEQFDCDNDNECKGSLQCADNNGNNCGYGEECGCCYSDEKWNKGGNYCEDNCEEEDYYECSSGKLYWYDSCDVKGDVMDNCDGNGCSSSGDYCYECDEDDDCDNDEVCSSHECKAADCDDFGGNYGSCNDYGALYKSGNVIYECDDMIFGSGEVLCKVKVSENGDDDFCDLASSEGSDCSHEQFDCDSDSECSGSLQCKDNDGSGCEFSEECGCCYSDEKWNKGGNYCEENCEAEDSYQCYNGDVYWYDSCGDKGNIKDNCGTYDTCVDDECVQKSCDELGMSESCSALGYNTGWSKCIPEGENGDPTKCEKFGDEYCYEKTDTCSNNEYCDENGMGDSICSSTECEVTNIEWSKELATEGETVYIEVTGNDECSGEQIDLKIYEDDGFDGLDMADYDAEDFETQWDPDDLITTLYGTLNSNGDLSKAWVTQYVEDGIGDPEFMVLGIYDGGKEEQSSNSLTVWPECQDKDDDGYYHKAGCGTAVDCDDNDDEKYPGNAEVCDFKDNNCNGNTDENPSTLCGGIDKCSLGDCVEKSCEELGYVDSCESIFDSACYENSVYLCEDVDPNLFNIKRCLEFENSCGNEQCFEEGNDATCVAQQCLLTDAYWNTASAKVGDAVEMWVEGTEECQGDLVLFQIYEDDSPFGSSLEWSGSVEFPQNKLKFKLGFDAFWVDDLVGDPEFYFDAIVEGQKIKSKTPNLQVSLKEHGESCADDVECESEVCSIATNTCWDADECLNSDCKYTQLAVCIGDGEFSPYKPFQTDYCNDGVMEVCSPYDPNSHCQQVDQYYCSLDSNGVREWKELDLMNDPNNCGTCGYFCMDGCSEGVCTGGPACGNNVCNVGENCPKDCFEVVEFTNVPNNVNSEENIEITAKFKNFGTVEMKSKAEAGLVPDSWQGFAFASFKDISKCCLGNEYYDAKEITLGPGEEEEVVFSLTAPNPDSVDTCAEPDSEYYSAWDDSFTLIAGTYDFCNGAYNFQIKQNMEISFTECPNDKDGSSPSCSCDFDSDCENGLICDETQGYGACVEEASCDIPDGSSSDCDCDSDNDCPSDHYCEFASGWDACVEDSGFHECDQVDDYQCVNGDVYRCEQVDAFRKLMLSDSCTYKEVCPSNVDDVKQCISQQDYDLILEYASSGTIVNKQPGDLLLVNVWSQHNTNLNFNYDTVNLDLLSGNCNSGIFSAGNNYCWFEVNSLGSYKFNLEEDQEELHVINDPYVLYLTNVDKLKNRFGDEAGVEVLLAKTYERAEQYNGVVYDLDVEVNVNHPFSSFASYSELLTPSSVRDNSYASATGQLSTDKCNGCREIIIVGDDYVVPSYVRSVSEFESSAVFESDTVKKAFYTDVEFVEREQLLFSDFDEVFKKNGEYQGKEVMFVLPSDIDQEMINAVQDLQQALVAKGYDPDFEQISVDDVVCQDGSLFQQWNGETLFIIGTEENNGAMSCYGFAPPSDGEGTAFMEKNLWDHDEYAVIINTDHSKVLEAFTELINSGEYVKLKSEKAYFFGVATEVVGYAAMGVGVAVLIAGTGGAAAPAVLIAAGAVLDGVADSSDVVNTCGVNEESVGWCSGTVLMAAIPFVPSKPVKKILKKAGDSDVVSSIVNKLDPYVDVIGNNFKNLKENYFKPKLWNKLISEKDDNVFMARGLKKLFGVGSAVDEIPTSIILKTKEQQGMFIKTVGKTDELITNMDDAIKKAEFESSFDDLLNRHSNPDFSNKKGAQFELEGFDYEDFEELKSFNIWIKNSDVGLPGANNKFTDWDKLRKNGDIVEEKYTSWAYLLEKAKKNPLDKDAPKVSAFKQKVIQAKTYQDIYGGENLIFRVKSDDVISDSFLNAKTELQSLSQQYNKPIKLEVVDSNGVLTEVNLNE